jgi:hypothetical protein
MIEKFVIRLMDDSDQLLGWTELSCESKPQGSRRSCPFWPKGVTQFPIERDGLATKITIHWCELDLAREQALDAPVEVKVGLLANYTWIGPVWLVPAMDKDLVLPPVTVRQTVALSPPAGSLVAAS